MKKSYKPLILSFMLVLGATILLVLSYLYVKIGYDLTLKQKNEAEEKIRLKNSIHEEYFSKYQFLTEKERITSYAEQELGMVYSSPSMIIKIDKSSNDLRELEKKINAKYEQQ